MKIAAIASVALAGVCLAAGGALADQQADDGSFTLPRDVVQAATAFEGYMTSAAHIDNGFADGAGVERSLKTGASYEPAQLEEGMIAYGAIAALQDDRFVDGVERAAGRGDQRTALGDRLVVDPYAVAQIDGAGEAGERVSAALAAESAPLVSTGTQVKAAAYTVQHQAWSKVMVADAAGRLAEVKSLSAVRAAPSEDDDRAMMQDVANANQGDTADAPSLTPIEAKALALAAESILGRSQGADRDRLSPLLSEHDSAFCLKMAKLNLYQCMAVAGPQYEDIYCLGQHALYDTASCVDQAAHGVGASTTVAMLSPRPTVPQGGAYTTVALHHTLRIAP